MHIQCKIAFFFETCQIWIRSAISTGRLVYSDICLSWCIHHLAKCFKIPVIPDSMNSEVTVLLMTLPNARFPCLVSIVNCLVIHCWIFTPSAAAVIKPFPGVTMTLKEEINVHEVNIPNSFMLHSNRIFLRKFSRGMTWIKFTSESYNNTFYFR